MSAPEVFKLYKSTKDSGWITATLESGVEATETGYGGFRGIRYRKIGSRVYVEGSVSTSWDGSNHTLLTQLPIGYRPQLNHYTLVPLTSSNIARIFISAAGNVYLEWVRTIANGSSVTSSLSWLAIDLDFPVD